MSDLDSVLAAIAAGDYDGHLDDIALAMVERARSGAVEFFWRIRLEGDEWTQESVTLGELRFAEQHCKVHYVDETGRTRTRRALMDEIDPRLYAEHLAALLTAHFHKAGELSLAEAVKKAEGYSRSVLKDAVDEYEVVHAPKDDTTSPESTSS